MKSFGHSGLDRFVPVQDWLPDLYDRKAQRRRYQRTCDGMRANDGSCIEV